ncbi:MAG: type III-A CRISPR-associated RAMP protein Csm4 [Candidatus Reconcilbacillus cellulovorans]|uniref:CRISPR system Cms protein Csm4 n=1 Tax=Candidatus Reconcilbacillus cellulovorans TaxID=1906605 RepID=A0A2A6DYG9_9BACL|nr:MAG: type III-A CRISPR-associated RAMP protein Csm4 [Candidatus Reconcilbacillus cellulovorans]
MRLTVEMRFRGPVRIGTGGFGMEGSGLILHSDTLFSALYIAWLRLYGGPVPKMRVSSAFPRAGGVVYYPRPQLPIPGLTPDDALAFGKSLKALRWVAEPSFFRWIRGAAFRAEDVHAMLKAEEVLDKQAAVRDRPRAAVDRFGAGTNLYWVGETFFADGDGLTFFAEVPDGEADRFCRAVEWLGDEGIGGRRSSGYGAFEPRFSASWPFEAATAGEAAGGSAGNAAGYVLLSLYGPNADERRRVVALLQAYHLVERTGWTESVGGQPGLRHRRVVMVAEGSVLREPVEGGIVDVAPDGFPHPVYRYGKAFLVGASASDGGAGDAGAE